jgi:hypothetical protein
MSGQYGSKINAVDKTRQRCTPLLLAVRNGASLIRLLLDYGASVKQRTADYRCTALHIATSRESFANSKCRGFVPLDFVDIIKLLIHAECSVNAVDLCGETALSLLCAHVQNEVIMPMYNTGASQVRYDIAVHRTILLEASRILMDAGASACGKDSQSLPLGVLAQQMQTLLGLLAHSNEPVATTEQALYTCHEMFFLLLSYCEDTLNGFRPDRVAVYIIEMLCQFAKRALLTVKDFDGEFIGNIITVVSDFFRMLLLLGAASDVIQLTSAICHCLEICEERFIHLLDMLLCVVDESSCRRVKVYLQTHSPSRFNKTQQIITKKCGSPRSLLQLCRVSLLSCFTPVNCMRGISSLSLPKSLRNYLLLIEH